MAGRVVLVRLLLILAAVSQVWAGAPLAQTATATSPCDLTTRERIVAIGDVHGAYDRYLAILREAGLIDKSRRWAGGRSVFVQVGDVLDRGADSRQVLDLLRRLEREAARAGGRVHFLLGNHEVMRMTGDLRMISAGEYAAFRTSGSEELRDQLYQILVEKSKAQASAAGTEFDEKAYRQQFLSEVPLGRIEMQRAFGPKGEYGRWLRERDILVKINGFLFLHGGISPAVAPRGCQGIVDVARTELLKSDIVDAPPPESFLMSPAGPLWYRGLATGEATAAEVEAILAAIGARAIVIGHTVPDDRRVTARFDNRVFQIDTGMLNGEFFPNGVASALEIHNGRISAIYEGRREVLVAGSGLTGK